MDSAVVNDRNGETARPVDLAVTDLGFFEESSESERKKLAASFDEGMRNIGFSVITGHGVPDELIRRMISVSSKFFDQPESVKRRICSRVAEGQFCGWVPFAADAASRVYGAGKDTPEDLRERFRAVISDREEVRQKVGPNQWLAELPELEATWTEYYRHMERLGLRVMRLAAAALRLDTTFFDPFFARHFSVLMCTNSPAFTGPRKPGQSRCGVHTDTGTMTFVYQTETQGGIEVQVDGEWRAPNPPAGSFIVNAGDLLALWTNARWRSTVHRVGGPNAAIEKRRVSVVFFHQPALDISLSCVPTCSDADHPARFQPTTLREHFTNQQRRLATRDAVQA